RRDHGGDIPALGDHTRLGTPRDDVAEQPGEVLAHRGHPGNLAHHGRDARITDGVRDIRAAHAYEVVVRVDTYRIVEVCKQRRHGIGVFDVYSAVERVPGESPIRSAGVLVIEAEGTSRGLAH